MLGVAHSFLETGTVCLHQPLHILKVGILLHNIIRGGMFLSIMKCSVYSGEIQITQSGFPADQFV